MATKIPFKIRGQRERVQQSFDLEKTTFLRAGKPVNLYNYIQEQTEDTDIYKTLEKYGCLDTLELSTEMIFGDFEKAMDLRDIYEQDIAFKNLWNSLPLKVREQFHNNRLEFMKNGEEWLKTEMAKEKANKPQPTDIKPQPTPKVEGETK